MLYAIKPNGSRIAATETGQRAICEICKGEVISKCGKINIWHWAHSSGLDCDSWHKPISAAHRAMQYGLEYNGARIEVPIERNGQKHRADAVLPNGTVVEIQLSSISPEEIEAREDFYQNMIWIFDARDAYDSNRLSFYKKGNYDTFRWKHPKKSIAFAKQIVFLYLEQLSLFRLKAIYPDAPCRGWGYFAKWMDVATSTNKKA